MKKHLLPLLGCLLVCATIARADDAAPAAEPTTSEPATVEPVAPAAADLIVAEAATGAPAAAPAATEGAATVVTGGSPVNDLIVIDDTPLLDAIRNLARTAGLNIMIDPRVTYGAPGADGKPQPQPSISIRWEKITAEQALLALLNNYGLQAVEDPKINITRITVKDPAAPDPLVTRTFQLQYASPTNIVPALVASLADKRSKVVPDIRTSQIVVVATEKELVEVEKLLAQLDTQTKQVLIEAKILETTVNPKTVKGIDWSGTLGGQNVAWGNNNKVDPPESTRNPLAQLYPRIVTQGSSFGTAFLNADGLAATLSFLNSYNDTRVVSEPRMVTLDNQKATIDVGLLFPVVQTTAGTANTTGGSQVEYTNLTVSLDVTPRIAANSFVELSVAQRILRLGPLFESTVGGQNNKVNSFYTRNAETVVLIPSGNTLVLGGLISDETSSANSKVPLVGDVPVLGGLFRHDSKRREKNNLMLFITPTVVTDKDYQPTPTTFLSSKPVSVDEADWSAWDSGQPRDWSKKGVKGGAVKSRW